jgi:hypothetical protein
VQKLQNLQFRAAAQTGAVAARKKLQNGKHAPQICRHHQLPPSPETSLPVMRSEEKEMQECMQMATRKLAARDGGESLKEQGLSKSPEELGTYIT